MCFKRARNICILKQQIHTEHSYKCTSYRKAVKQSTCSQFSARWLPSSWASGTRPATPRCPPGKLFLPNASYVSVNLGQLSNIYFQVDCLRTVCAGGLRCLRGDRPLPPLHGCPRPPHVPARHRLASHHRWHLALPLCLVKHLAYRSPIFFVLLNALVW